MLIRFFVIRKLNRCKNYNLYTLFDMYVIMIIQVTNDSIYEYKGGKFMKKELQENFDENNIQNVEKMIKNSTIQPMCIFLKETGNGLDVKVTKGSREQCAKSLLK